MKCVLAKIIPHYILMSHNIESKKPISAFARAKYTYFNGNTFPRMSQGQFNPLSFDASVVPALIIVLVAD